MNPNTLGRLFMTCQILLITVASVFAQNKIQLQSFDTSKGYQKYGGPTIGTLTTGEKVPGVNSVIGVLAPSIHKFSLSRNSSTLKVTIGVIKTAINDTDSDITSIPLTDGERMLYKGEGTNKRFIGVGGQDGGIATGSVVYKIIGDGKELYNSGTRRPSDGIETIIVSVKGVQVLELTTEDAGDGSSGDYAMWADGEFDYFEIEPSIVSIDYLGEVPEMEASTQKYLSTKIEKLESTTLPLAKPSFDWLIEPQKAEATVLRSENNKDIVLTNGLVSRIFRIFPNLATIDVIDQMNEETMLRAVSPEGSITIDHKQYSLGGLKGQPEFGFLRYEWIDQMTSIPNSFVVADIEVSEITERIAWARSRWASNKKAPTGKVLTFTMKGTNEVADVVVKLHYAIYDGIPTISKWFEVENNSDRNINIDKFKLEELAMVEGESPVDTPDHWKLPNLHVEADWSFGAMQQEGSDVTQYWEKDPRYTSQCNYPLATPCVLEVKLPMGPDVSVSPNETFETFRVWETLYDSYDRERKGLTLRRMYRTISPWSTENPIFLHCVSNDEKVVKRAIDQCKECGYEMVILSFGSGVNMEDEKPENYEKYRRLNDYAKSQGIELGGYSLLSSRWISDEVDVINPKTGKRGGMIFGSSPCLSSEWGHEYFRMVKKFYEKTGMTVFENDGSYPGNVCASTSHAHHKGLNDSQWEQRKMIANLYKWMCEEGIYTNVPDFYINSGTTKTGIGYREVNWSLPRERQLVLGRQVMYDGLWTRMPSMCWTFVPLTQYHGGGAAATLEPLSEHIPSYKAHMMQNYGSGVQACYRGPRLYDTEKTKEAVVEVIDWYKKYRTILNSDLIHLRRADGRDWDGILHVNPEEKEKGLVMLYNPTNEEMTRTISLPLYYTGIEKKASIREKEGKAKSYTLNRDYTVEIEVVIPANNNTWLVIE